MTTTTGGRRTTMDKRRRRATTTDDVVVSDGVYQTKNVLILISYTGGGHRASAEAFRDAFRLEFRDEYNIDVKDVWKEYTGWPLNSMESQYKFMVKHVQLWNVAFHSTSPKWFHSVYLAAIAAFYAKYFIDWFIL
ncbi:hypothetical protein QQ045_010888 [Rhodiola kirilowii]